MKPIDIAAIVSSDGRLKLRNWHTGAVHNVPNRIDLSGLDGRVLRMFDRLLAKREQEWPPEDIRLFGQLLHRRLFPGEAWEWVERQRVGKRHRRLMLAFPADQPSSYLAALPWEFLCAPDDAEGPGRFLALMPDLILSRVVPSGGLDDVRAPSGTIRVLPVVGIDDDPRLGEVRYDEVLAAIRATSDKREFEVAEAIVGATEQELRAGVGDVKPHIVHYLGHARFRDGRGAVALRCADGGADWVEESRLAEALCPAEWPTPIVILHACEGGAAEFESHFAGLAPSITRQGALCVVGMQYAVLNSTAIAFSGALYEALADQVSLDEALRRARLHLHEHSADPRLIGIPTIYQRSIEPLLVPTRGAA